MKAMSGQTKRPQQRANSVATMPCLFNRLSQKNERVRILSRDRRLLSFRIRMYYISYSSILSFVDPVLTKKKCQSTSRLLRINTFHVSAIIQPPLNVSMFLPIGTQHISLSSSPTTSIVLSDPLYLTPKIPHTNLYFV